MLHLHYSDVAFVVPVIHFCGDRCQLCGGNCENSSGITRPWHESADCHQAQVNQFVKMRHGALCYVPCPCSNYTLKLVLVVEDGEDFFSYDLA